MLHGRREAGRSVWTAEHAEDIGASVKDRDCGGKMLKFYRPKRQKPIRKVSAKQRKKIAARRELRVRWWNEGKRTCGICGTPIRTLEDMTNDHIVPGNGKDDSPENQQPAHGICNNLKGSKRNYSQQDCLRDLRKLGNFTSFTATANDAQK